MGVPVVLVGARATLELFSICSHDGYTTSLRVLDNHGSISNPAVVYVTVKHNPTIYNWVDIHVPYTSSQQQPIVL